MRMMKGKKRNECATEEGKERMEKWKKMADTGERYQVDSTKVPGTVIETWSCGGIWIREQYEREEGALRDFTKSLEMEHAQCWNYNRLPSDDDPSGPYKVF